MRVFVSTVVCAPLDQVIEHENLLDVLYHDVQDPPPLESKDFRDYWVEVIENGHLSSRKFLKVFNNCYSYIVVIGSAFLERFPEVIIALRKREREREEREVNRLLDTMWLLVFCVISSWCYRFVFSV